MDKNRYTTIVEACNKCANFFADTTDVDYYSDQNTSMVMRDFSEYKENARGMFPELRPFVRGE
jgi:hypothetical protein